MFDVAYSDSFAKNVIEWNKETINSSGIGSPSEHKTHCNKTLNRVTSGQTRASGIVQW